MGKKHEKILHEGQTDGKRAQAKILNVISH